MDPHQAEALVPAAEASAARTAGSELTMPLATPRERRPPRAARARTVFRRRFPPSPRGLGHPSADASPILQNARLR
jgi:hypothetical protein